MHSGGMSPVHWWFPMLKMCKWIFSFFWGKSNFMQKKWYLWEENRWSAKYPVQRFIVFKHVCVYENGHSDHNYKLHHNGWMFVQSQNCCTLTFWCSANGLFQSRWSKISQSISQSIVRLEVHEWVQSQSQINTKDNRGKVTEEIRVNYAWGKLFINRGCDFWRIAFQCSGHRLQSFFYWKYEHNVTNFSCTTRNFSNSAFALI